MDKKTIQRRVGELMYATIKCEHGTFLVLGNTDNPRHLLDAFSGFISFSHVDSIKVKMMPGGIKIVRMAGSKIPDAMNLFASSMKPVYSSDGSNNTLGIKMYTVPMSVKFSDGVNKSLLNGPVNFIKRIFQDEISEH